MTTLLYVKRWPCEAICDAPGCHERVDNAVYFEEPVTPGLDTLYLCEKHTKETEARYV